MLITEIKQLINERHSMSLRELSIHFKMEPEAIEPALDIIVKKGTVKIVDLKCSSCKSSCPGCSEANRPDMLIYQAIPDNYNATSRE